MVNELARLLAFTLLAQSATGGSPGDKKPLASVNVFTDIPVWSVVVWPDGRVEAVNSIRPHLSGSYTLRLTELAEFRRVLETERPWELSGSMGSLPVHGPTRVIEVTTAHATAYSAFTQHRPAWRLSVQLIRVPWVVPSGSVKLCAALGATAP
jgi:hypothetical protein